MLPTVDALHVQLDADPGNHLLRLALADALDEAAGAVDCPKCYSQLRAAGLARHCTCSGAGRVSDGKAEIAAGLRVLAESGRYPRFTTGSFNAPWLWWTIRFRPDAIREPDDGSDLDDVWFRKLAGGERLPHYVAYPTRRTAEEDAALAWHKLKPHVQARILVPAAKRP